LHTYESLEGHLCPVVKVWVKFFGFKFHHLYDHHWVHPTEGMHCTHSLLTSLAPHNA